MIVRSCVKTRWGEKTRSIVGAVQYLCCDICNCAHQLFRACIKPLDFVSARRCCSARFGLWRQVVNVQVRFITNQIITYIFMVFDLCRASVHQNHGMAHGHRKRDVKGTTRGARARMCVCVWATATRASPVF